MTPLMTRQEPRTTRMVTRSTCLRKMAASMRVTRGLTAMMGVTRTTGARGEGYKAEECATGREDAREGDPHQRPLGGSYVFGNVS